MAGKRHRTASAKDVFGNGFYAWETGRRVEWGMEGLGNEVGKVEGTEWWTAS